MTNPKLREIATQTEGIAQNLHELNPRVKPEVLSQLVVVTRNAWLPQEPKPLPELAEIDEGTFKSLRSTWPITDTRAAFSPQITDMLDAAVRGATGHDDVAAAHLDTYQLAHFMLEKGPMHVDFLDDTDPHGGDIRGWTAHITTAGCVDAEFRMLDPTKGLRNSTLRTMRGRVALWLARPSAKVRLNEGDIVYFNSMYTAHRFTDVKVPRLSYPILLGDRPASEVGRERSDFIDKYYRP